jgi:DNA-binding transcriptional regulator YdaS (Cro superfamily)
LPDARRSILYAAGLVYGKRWQSALAASSGLSQALLSMIASESRQRELTPAATSTIVEAIRGEIAREAKQHARALEMLAGIK